MPSLHEYDEMSSSMPSTSSDAKASCCTRFARAVACSSSSSKSSPASFFSLFRFASPSDLAYLAAGFTCAVLSGCAQPVLAIFYGNVYGLIGAAETNSTEFRDGAYKSVYGIIGLAGGVTVVNFFTYFCFDRSCSRILGRMRIRFIASILRQNAGWFDRNHAGALVMQLNENVDRIGDALGDKLALLTRGVSTLICATVISFIIEWRLALFFLAFTPLTCLCMDIMSRCLTSSSNSESTAVGHAGSVAEESVLGVRTVQAFNGQEEMLGRYKKQFEKGKTAAWKKSVIGGFFGGFFFFILHVYQGCGYLFGGFLLRIGAVEDSAPIITVILAELLAAFFLGIVSPQFVVILNARVAAAEIYATIDRCPRIDPESEKGQRPSSCNGAISFRGVHFRYPTRKDVKILNGFTLSIAAGQRVAFVGHSGCGKSTAVGLLTRLYEAERGQVEINGVDVRQLNLEWLRCQVGIVQQEPALFNGTIEENLRMGREDLTSREMEECCRMSNAHDFISKLPKGYSTVIGAGGVQLSGGQKQRVAIARVLARNPRILLLDEATSALDTESERIVQDALDRASTGRTTIAIAHRLSTVRNADKIVVFDKGEIAEIGTHDELMALGGRYYELVRVQSCKATEEDGESESNASIETSRSPSLTKSGREAFERAHKDNDSHLRFSTRSTARQQQQNEKPSMEEKVEMRTDVLRILRAGGWQTVPALLLAIIRGLENPAISLVFTYAIGSYGLTATDAWQMQHQLVIAMIGYCCLGVGCFIFQFASSLFFGSASWRSMLRFRLDSLRSILHQDGAFFDDPSHSPGKLITRLATDVPNVSALLDARMMYVITYATSWLVCNIFAFIWAWSLGLILFVMSCILYFLMYLAARKVHAVNAELAKRDESGKLSIEIVESVRTIQLLTRQKLFVQKYTDACKVLRSTDGGRRVYEALNFTLTQSSIFYQLSAGYSLAIWHMYKSHFSMHDIYVSLISLTMANVSIMLLSSFFPDFVKARTASALLFNIIDRKPATGDIHEGQKVKLSGSIRLDSVAFAYPQRKHQPVARGLSFSASKGQTVALVGPSGAGKSSVISLLERFYNVDGGRVLFDGTDIKSASLASIREQMALVGQEPRLFAGTIRENVCFGMYREIRDEEVFKALETANALQFLSRMPLGLDTDVGSGGSALSGGQKQRIAIARALVRNPVILLLDEATSALDTESEKVVQEALERAAGGRTCITIAHRLSSIRNADKIVYVDGGRVLETGSHDELTALRGHYWKLVRAQTLA